MANITGNIETTTRSKKANFPLFLLIGAAYFLSFVILADKYGMTHDEPGIFNAGELYLEYLQTGNKKFLESNHDSQKKLSSLNLEKHPWHKEGGYPRINHPQIIPILSAVSCDIFFQKLNWLDSIDAHQLPLWFISSIGISILAIFIYYETNSLFLSISSALFLGLFPRFFAMSHNNPVDAASAIAIMIGAISFYAGFKSKKFSLILMASVLLGVNFDIKANAVITVLATLSWLLIERKGRLWNHNWKENDVFILPVYFFMAFVVFIACHPYYWDVISVSEIYTKSILLIEYEKGTGVGMNPNWNFTQPFLLFAVTPPIMLLTFPFGLAYLYKNYRSLFFLFFFIFFWSLFRTCLPYSKNFHGIRHFIEIGVPLSVFSAAGLYCITHWCSKKILTIISVNKVLLASFFLALFCMIFSIYQYFPYEIVYFNSLVGGAKQAAMNPYLRYYTGDYWQTSSREIINWLNKNGEKNAQIYDLIGISHYYHDTDAPESYLRNDFVFPDNYRYEGDLFSNTICSKFPWLDRLKSIQQKKPGFIKNPACFAGNGYMIITSLTQEYKWRSLYITLLLNSERVEIIKRDSYPITTIVRANVVIIYDKKTIFEALHFDLDSKKIFILE